MFLLLAHWLWISQWRMLGTGLHTSPIGPYWTDHVHNVFRRCSWSGWCSDEAVRIKNCHYRGIYLNRPLANELPEESDQFRFLRAACLANLKGSVGLILVKTSEMRSSIPLDLSSWSFIQLPRFIRSRRPTTFLVPSLVLFPPRSG
jgi:hypothetical protein